MSDRLTPILNAVRARIEAAGFQLSGTTLPVLLRTATVHREGLDPDGGITVSKSPAPEETTRRRFGVRQTRYRVAVVVHAPAARPEADQQPYAKIRDGIVDLFGATPPPGGKVLPGAPDVFDVDAAPAEWLRPYSDETSWDWFGLEVSATVAHA